MNGDYLWDRSGTPDPEVQRLEELLAPYRSGAGPGPTALANSTLHTHLRPSPHRVAGRLGMAAALLLAVGAMWLLLELTRGAWEVTDVEGSVRVGGRQIAGDAIMATGEWLETGAVSGARISLAIGSVRVGPYSRIRLVKADLTEQRMQLAQGGVHVNVYAPPNIFFVETPSAVAVDMGCEYLLDVDLEGAGRLEVRLGWVSFERGGRRSKVPRGGFCLTRPETGPGTPFFVDAQDSFKDALAKLDAHGSNERVLVAVLANARKRDTLSLWHLLSRLEGRDRADVYEKMALLMPPPPEVTRAGVLRLDAKMLAVWWDALYSSGYW